MAHAKGYQYAIYCGNLLSNIWGRTVGTNRWHMHAESLPTRQEFPFPFLSLSFPFSFLFLCLSFPVPFPFPCPFPFLSLPLSFSFPFPLEANCPMGAKALPACAIRLCNLFLRGYSGDTPVTKQDIIMTIQSWHAPTK